jgi:dienelactone hydrolase
MHCTLRHIKSSSHLITAACWLLIAAGCPASPVVAPQSPAAATPPDPAAIAASAAELEQLRNAIESLKSRRELQTASGEALLADVRVYEKAAAWMLRFNEFPKPDALDRLRAVLAEGKRRVERLQAGQPDWHLRPGTSIRGYVSAIDGTHQPFAVTLPAGVEPASSKRWPLHVVLHGRADDMNEVSFITRMDGRGPGASKDERPGDWIQLDVYGRGNNAYRWAGETDVFEAMAAVRQRFRIDEDRVVLHGFSMGGAGAWHLGLHHPHLWCSVGAGAGFVDFYNYQKKNPDSPQDRLPFAQNQTLRIYDAVPWALNLANVPFVTYGGEKDPQLLASTTMQQAAEQQGVPLRLIVGAGMGHAFDPASRREFMEFHEQATKTGRPRFGERGRIRFTTTTLRYNRCDWLAIMEFQQEGKSAVVETERDSDGTIRIKTQNVALFTAAREIAEQIGIDGTLLDCRTAAGELLPEVWYRRTGTSWVVLDYQESRGVSRNPDISKRPGLQGPIDDAFMSAFVCVRGTARPLQPRTAAWADKQLSTFQQEFSKWMRGEARVVNDVDVTEELLSANHVILFGDPGSNLLLRTILAAVPDANSPPAEVRPIPALPPIDSKVIEKLPFRWDAEKLMIGGQSWPADSHALCLVFPNPFNRNKYMVVNTGHTFSERDFRASNAWLFPRFGDAAVLKLSDPGAESAQPELVWSDVFGTDWKLPVQAP